MTFNSTIGAERPSPSPRAGSPAAGLPGSGVCNAQPAQHSPEAEGLLQRYLSEIHSYRQLGNAALRELETRLAALSSEPLPWEAQLGARTAASPLMHSSLAAADAQEEKSPALTDRLRELSTYLHADLTKHQEAARTPTPAERNVAPAHLPPLAPASNAAPANARQPAHKSTPSAPVLDRSWFEERFAEMRSSIDQVAEKIPTSRLDALEMQFHALMEKLEARDADRSMAPVEAGLKKLAAYLEDNRQWTSAQDARVRGVEDRLDQLSGLVAQSHAAISATAMGLEMVARGTGPELARKTADLVADKLDERLESLNQNAVIGEMARDVATLANQSTQLARTTDERLRQLQICLDESLDRLNDEIRDAAHDKPKTDFDAETYEDEEDGEDDLPPAQRAARLAAAPVRDMPQQGEPLRYQIPYGEFLPDEERRDSPAGLIVAAVILVLASAAMLYLNLRDRHPSEGRPKPVSSLMAPTRDSAIPVTTASIAPSKIAERMLHPAAPTGIALSNEVWVTSVTAEETTPRDHSRTASLAPVSGDVGSPARTEQVASTGEDSSDLTRKAAVQGDVNAQFSVGQDYLDGKGVERQLPVGERLSKAARWFRRAAENGHAASQYRLATLYELGQGAPKDIAESMVWYERAAERGHVKAMHNLAVLSITGNGKSANYLSAAKWFGQAAEHGLRDSQYNLGILYERGLGVEKDRLKAYRWFSVAAQNGDVTAAQRRDDIARSLTDAELKAANNAVLAWKVAPVDEAVNRAAPEPPVEDVRKAEAIIQPKAPSAQLLKTGWSTQIAARDNLIAEAQRLLAKLGYKPGPADGIAGPRTLAAIREFETRIGLRATGQINEALLAKMAFAQI